MARPATPEPVKRELRQQAGFGCCVCGHPILQYHHIVPWETEQHFRPEDMMVLCPNHHDQATKKAFPEGEQRAAKALPINIKRKLAKGLLELRQSYAAIDLGSVQMVGDRVGIYVDDIPVISVFANDEGVMFVSAHIYDEHDQEIASIVDNEWISGDPLAWDIVADYRYIAIREKVGHINIEIDGRTMPAQVRGRFSKGGHWVIFDQRGLWIGDTGAPMSIQNLALANGSIRITTGNRGFALVPQVGEKCMIISEGDLKQRLYKARDAYLRLKRERQATST